MNAIIIYSIISVIIVSLISLVGLSILAISTKKLQNIIMLLVSFSAGALLGDAFLHLLPDAKGTSTEIATYILLGIIISFIIEKFVNWHHCHHHHHEGHEHHEIQSFAIMNLVGDSVHNFIDGLVIGGSYIASIQLGITTTLAVILHEIPQEFGDFGVLIHGGFTKWKAIFYNFITALTAVVGAIVALTIGSTNETFINFLIPFATGGFIYIAGSDLIPELHRETKISVSLLQLISLLAGIGMMYLLLIVG